MIIISLLLLSSPLPHLSFSASVNVDIVNGREAQPHSRPYMVSIQNNGRHICGGSLISDQFVMTAAHCRHSTEKWTVVAGAHDLSKWENRARIDVLSYNPHPDYKTDEYSLFKGDLMILKLNQKVQLNHNIKTISIPKKPVKMKVGTDCSVAGWGFMTNHDSASPTLREANVKVMNTTVCANRWGRRYIRSEMMCVHGSGGSCVGDSGGPLVCDDTAVGVTSFSRPSRCNDNYLYNVYIDISAFLPWIHNITGLAN